MLSLLLLLWWNGGFWVLGSSKEDYRRLLLICNLMSNKEKEEEEGHGEGEGEEEVMSESMLKVNTDEKSCATLTNVKTKYCNWLCVSTVHFCPRQTSRHPEVSRSMSFTAASCELQRTAELQLDSVLFDLCF